MVVARGIELKMIRTQLGGPSEKANDEIEGNTASELSEKEVYQMWNHEGVKKNDGDRLEYDRRVESQDTPFVSWV